MTSPSPGMNSSGDDHDDIAGAQFGAGDRFDRAVRAQTVGLGFRAGFAQRVGLRFAAAFGHGFGEIGEEHREPEPQRDLQAEAEIAGVVESVER